MYTIGEVARLAHVTQRLLRHYDEIGLLVPSGRSEAGYRLYRRADLERLQQILFYRVLQFPLEEIQRLMDDPACDRQSALQHQRHLLEAKAAELRALTALIDKTLADIHLPEEKKMSIKEMFEVFPEVNAAQLAEAEQRWGESEAWKQSAKRSAQYRKEDWERMKEEMEAVNEHLAEVFAAGLAPDADEAIAAVEAARQLIHRWHYDCSRQFHVDLTAMTSSDPRFVANIDKKSPGLAAFIHAAARANLERNPQ